MPEKLESFNKWFEQFDFDGSRKDDLYIYIGIFKTLIFSSQPM